MDFSAKTTVVKHGGMSKSIVLGNKANVFDKLSYHISTCDFDPFLPCTFRGSWEPAKKDLDIAIAW